MDFFTVLGPKGGTIRYDLAREIVRIGRATPKNDLVLADDHVSRYHAELRREGSGHILHDINSRNGTTVNGRAVMGPVRLQPGDRIRLGETTLLFNASGPTSLEINPSPLPWGAETTVVPARDVISAESIEAVSGPVLTKTRAIEDPLTPNEIVSAFDLQLSFFRPQDEILNELIDLAHRAVGFERGFVILLERGEPTVRVRRLPPGDAAGAIDISKTVLDRVLGQHESILTVDVSNDLRLAASESLGRQQIRSVMCVPLLAGEKVLGLIYVDTRRQVDRFSERDLRLLTFLANQAAVAVDRARLFDEEHERKWIERELREAAHLQVRLMPSKAPRIPGYLVDASSSPCREVGGDFYDYFELPDGRYAIAVADVAGKGLPAALLMAGFQARLQCLAGLAMPLDELFSRLNGMLYGSIPASRFVALFYGILDPVRHTLTWVNAGQAPPLLMRSDSRVERLEIGSLPVGLLPDVTFKPETIEMLPGDCLACYSDGVIDAQDAAEEFFGEERFVRCLRSTREKEPAYRVQEVVDAVKSHCVNAHPGDDVTLMILERRS